MVRSTAEAMDFVCEDTILHVAGLLMRACVELREACCRLPSSQWLAWLEESSKRAPATAPLPLRLHLRATTPRGRPCHRTGFACPSSCIAEMARFVRRSQFARLALPNRRPKRPLQRELYMVRLMKYLPSFKH